MADKMPSLVDDGSLSPPSTPPAPKLEKSLEKTGGKRPTLSRIRTAVGKYLQMKENQNRGINLEIIIFLWFQTRGYQKLETGCMAMQRTKVTIRMTMTI